MSIVPCSDQSCIYQKDGQCELNTVTTGIHASSTSSCFYYQTKTNSENEVQNQEISPNHGAMQFRQDQT